MNTLAGTRKIDYDTLLPDEKITSALSFFREVKARYDGNIRAVLEKESELQDLEHCAELHQDMDCKGGYALYKKIREARRERRAYKNENELLFPVYEWIGHNENALNKLAEALGRVRKTAEVIDNRQYTPRTDVLADRL